MKIEPSNLKRLDYLSNMTFEPSEEDVNYTIEALNISICPVILIGSGVRSSKAIKEFEYFINHHPFPVVLANSAVDIYGTSNKLSIGVIGNIGGTKVGNTVLENADLLIILGHRMSTMTIGENNAKFLKNKKIIVVDIDKIEHSKETIKIDKLIIADVKKFLILLMQHTIRSSNDYWIDKCLKWKKEYSKCEERHKESERVDLYYLSDCLSEMLPENAVLLTDAGLEELIIPSNVKFTKGQRCIHPVSQGSMGYALPGAIGAYYASNETIVAVIGDGSIMMNLQELQTIVHNNIPIKILVINNNMYATIRNRQKFLFRTRTIGTDPSNGVSSPNFYKVAECFGLNYFLIENSQQLLQMLKIVFTTGGPVLCEIMGIENQEYH